VDDDVEAFMAEFPHICADMVKNPIPEVTRGNQHGHQILALCG